MTDNANYLTAPVASEIEIGPLPEVATVVAQHFGLPVPALREAFDSTFTALFPALAERGIHPSGPAFALYGRTPSDTVDLEIGVPVATPLESPITAGSGTALVASKLPAGRVARVSHVGSYDELGIAWRSFIAALTARGESLLLPFWEVYVTEPTPDGDPSAMRTDLYTLVAG